MTGAATRSRLWRRRPTRLAAVALVCAVVALALGAWTMANLGHWLMVADPLEPARAITVLGGSFGFRSMEAATLYRQGWAPEVWITRGPPSTEEEALGRLGLYPVRQETYTRTVLERLAVPSGVIRLLPRPVRDTAEEVRMIASELRPGERVILVTSKSHSRRLRTTWDRLIGDARVAVVRYARDDPYRPDGWWRNTSDALATSREVLGLLNLWAGFPVRHHGAGQPAIPDR